MSPAVAFQHESFMEPRWIVGVHVAMDGHTLAGVLLQLRGHGLALQVELAAHRTQTLPNDYAEGWARFASEEQACRPLPAELQATLSQTIAELIVQLLTQKKRASQLVHTIGLTDAGLWNTTAEANRQYHPIADAHLLAELTGLNVVGAFPARDLSQGGLGGPLFALPQWVLLRDLQRQRVLVELDQSIQITSIPKFLYGQSSGEVLSWQVGPGIGLLNALVQHFTEGQATHDAKGHLAVHGRCLPALLAELLEVKQRPPPCWSPEEVESEQVFQQILDYQQRQPASLNDLLCTASHFLVQLIARSVKQFLPQEMHAAELLLAGSGQDNGMLLSELYQTLPGMRIRRLRDCGIADAVLPPACAALLANFLMDQIPGNLPAVTDCQVPRVLGSITPGAPQNWHRWLREAGIIAGEMSLRSAM